MENLRSYLKAHGIRQAAFASRVNATQGTISRLVSGTAKPSLTLALAIERETAGSVPVAVWAHASRGELAAE